MPKTETLILDQYRNAAQVDDAGHNNYRGLRIHTLKGLHEVVGGVIEKTIPRSSKVLDLAAGSGAMSLRLLDLGMVPLACDMVSENFRLHDSIPFRIINLNQEFPEEFIGHFDCVVAIEIIEHLENPRHFLRQCFAALKQGGRLILTTPNIDSALSRAELFRSGSHKWFSQRDYEHHGHITPVSAALLRNAATEAGFNLKNPLIWDL